MTHRQLTLADIKLIFEDFLIVTGVKQYDHTSAIHTSLLYEYCLGKSIAQGYTLEEYSMLMNIINRYALEKGREGSGDE